MDTSKTATVAGDQAAPVARFTWEKAFRSSGIGKTGNGAAALAVGFVFASYANADGTSVHPGEAVVAEGTGVSRSTVTRALKRLREDGWLLKVREGNRRTGQADEYALTIPSPRPCVTSDARSTTDHASSQPDHASSQTDHASSQTDHASSEARSCVTSDAPPVQGPSQRPEQLPVQRGTDVPPSTQSVWDDHWAEDDDVPPAAAPSGEEKWAPPVPFSGEREESQPVRYFEEAPPVPQDEELGYFGAKEQRRRERKEQAQPERYVSAYVRSWRDA